jgi:HEAT repeat protein
MTVEISKLIAALESGLGGARVEAAEKLARLEAAAQPAAVPLIAACDTDDQALADWAAAALEGLGPPRVEDIGKLAELAERETLDVAWWAVTLLGRLQERAAPAAPQLIKALDEHPVTAVRERAAWALAKIGPGAADARPALARAAESSNPRLAALAREALKSIP